MEEMRSIFEYYKTIDSVDSSAPSRNRTFDGMEADKPDCESSDVPPSYRMVAYGSISTSQVTVYDILAKDGYYML